jgi:hypothetical protein
VNFKVRDTAWFVGVGASVLSFMIGLFSGFFLSGVPVFFVNMLLFMMGAVTVIAGGGLLLAAAEVHAKLHDFKANPILQAHSNLYSVAVGEDRDSLQAHEVIDSLQEYDVENLELPAYVTEAKEISYREVGAKETDTVFDLETAPMAFVTEEINPLPLTKTELLAKIDKVQEIITHNKASEVKETTDPGKSVSNPRIVTLEYPKTKPTIHEKLTVETINEFENKYSKISAEEFSEIESNAIIDIVEEIPVTPKSDSDLRKIILIGGKGIDPSSDRFKELLVQASQVEDEAFSLRLKGKTFGLGARGIKVQRKNTEFTVFNKSDISKMLKKFSN